MQTIPRTELVLRLLRRDTLVDILGESSLPESEYNRLADDFIRMMLEKFMESDDERRRLFKKLSDAVRAYKTAHLNNWEKYHGNPPSADSHPLKTLYHGKPALEQYLYRVYQRLYPSWMTLEDESAQWMEGLVSPRVLTIINEWDKPILVTISANPNKWYSVPNTEHAKQYALMDKANISFHTVQVGDSIQIQNPKIQRQFLTVGYLSTSKRADSKPHFRMCILQQPLNQRTTTVCEKDLEPEIQGWTWSWEPQRST